MFCAIWRLEYRNSRLLKMPSIDPFKIRIGSTVFKNPNVVIDIANTRNAF